MKTNIKDNQDVKRLVFLLKKKHKNLKISFVNRYNNAYGDFKAPNCITINTKYCKNPTIALLTIAHEYNHYLDMFYKGGRKYYYFFTKSNLYEKISKVKYIIDNELRVDSKGYNFLKRHGFNIKHSIFKKQQAQLVLGIKQSIIYRLFL